MEPSSGAEPPRPRGTGRDHPSDDGLVPARRVFEEGQTVLRDTWQRNAEQWIAWARTPMHDSFWHFHRDGFLTLLPDPGVLTVDIGAGEGD
ncbi:hypothetical protein BH23ACT10_BH23ACT10_39640 [soil metagenome]